MEKIAVEKNALCVGDYDVVVCGGGPAGFVAAIAAAREGARTAVIERYGFFGGMATAAYVMPISVFSYNGVRNIGGIPWLFVKELEKLGGALIEEPLNNIAFDPELYKLCAQRMVIQAGVDLYMNSYISGCISENNRINAVVIENKNGTEAIRGKIFIDATGDADLAYMAGCPMQEWNEKNLQPCSMCFILSGVDTSSPLIAEAMHHNKQGENCHCLPVRNRLLELRKSETFPDFGGPWFCCVLHDGSVAVNMTRILSNSCDNRDFTRAECQLREDVFTFAGILKREFPEFRNSYISSVALQAGIRESRHIKGVHVITGEEYVNAFRYEDSISRCAHPIDIHSAKNDSQNIAFLDKAAYIPYRSMIVKSFPNLVVAGRSISADNTAFASVRVQASCMGIGQAAGIAAALCSFDSSPVDAVDITTLINRLKDLGAVLD